MDNSNGVLVGMTLVLAGAFGVLTGSFIRKRLTWAAICRFAYRRAMGERGGVPDGLPGHRSPVAQCQHFWPVKNVPGDGPCLTDGHYLCKECAWISREAQIERGYVNISEAL